MDASRFFRQEIQFFIDSYVVQLMATAGACVTTRGVNPLKRPPTPSALKIDLRQSKPPAYRGIIISASLAQGAVLFFDVCSMATCGAARIPEVVVVDAVEEKFVVDAMAPNCCV